MALIDPESAMHTGSHKIFKILNQVQNDKNFGSLCKVQGDAYSIIPHLMREGMNKYEEYMNLEDMIALTKHPYDGLEILIETLEDEIAQNNTLTKDKESYYKIMSYISAIKAMAKYLQDLRNEFRTVVNKR